MEPPRELYPEKVEDFTLPADYTGACPMAPATDETWRMRKSIGKALHINPDSEDEDPEPIEPVPVHAAMPIIEQT